MVGEKGKVIRVKERGGKKKKRDRLGLQKKKGGDINK